MKRILHALLLALSMFSAFDVAAAKQRPPKRTSKETVVTTESGAAVKVTAPVKPEKKQVDPGGTIVAKPGPIPVGPPVELQLKRASSRTFDLRSLPQTRPIPRERPELEPPDHTPVTVEGGSISPEPNHPAVPTPSAPAPAPLNVFEGLDRFNWGAGSPPDTNGDVGPAHYIQTVNTSIGVFRKSDGFREAAFTFDTFMKQGNFGNLCDTNNFGDPVVLYDTFEDRWIVTDFAFVLDGSGNVAAPAYQCIAASMNGDPVTGGWNFYSIQIADNLNDYPKFGIWPDGLYMSSNLFSFGASSFQGVRVWAFNKAQMYAGSPTVKVVSFNLGTGDFTVIPSNARLQAGTPPAGRPNLFVSTWNFLNALTVYKFHVDWNSISLSTFTGPDVPIAGTSWPNASVANAAQPGTATLLDVLQIRAMVQNQYTNQGGMESLWVPHTVRRATGGLAAPRWYQVNVTGGTVAANLPQATTWDPDGANVVNRFMPSLALDRAGNMAMGYSTSNGTTEFPSMKYAGRLAADPVNTFSQTEQTFFTGTASQTGTTRWGDYSSMTLDPDGCTFWYASEYANPADQTFNHRWLTKFGSFRFSECTPVGGGGTVSGTVTATLGGTPIAGATVQLGARSTTTNGSGFYQFLTLPAGTYPGMTASAPGFNPSTINSIVVNDGATTTQDFSLSAAAASACATDTTQADFQTGVLTNVDVSTSPGDVILANVPNVDQANTTLSNSGVGITTTTWGGQTFTAAVTGTLTKADINLFCSGCTGTFPNLTLSVRATSGNLPSGGDLATATLNGNNSGASSYFTGTFAIPPTLTAGTTYALLVRPTANPSPGIYALTRSATNVYAGGQRVSSTDSGTTWTAPLTSGQTTDAGFRTYMQTGFAANGNLVSSPKDSNPAAGLTPIWSTLSWNGTTPANTTLRFQAAGSSSVNGPFNFVGPDGTAATFFTTSPVSLTRFYGLRFVEYKAYLGSTDGAVTPSLNDATLCFADVDCSGPGPVITAAPTQVCANSTGNTASGPAGETSYSWSIVNGVITGGSSSQTVMYTAGATGNVALMLNVAEPSGCQKSSSLSVSINPTPATPTITPAGSAAFCVAGSVTLTSSSASGNQWYLDGNTIGGATSQTYAAAAAGSYTVQVTISGCASAMSAPTLVTVNPPPPAPTITPGGPTTFCAGGNVTLTSSSASGYQWYLNDNPIDNATNRQYVAMIAGSYTVKVTDGNGCVSPASAATSVVVNPIPAKPTITPSPSVTFCFRDSVTLTSSSATGNQWYFEGIPIQGATNQTLVVTKSMIGFAVDHSAHFSVVVTENGCSSPSSDATLVTYLQPVTPSITAAGPTTFCAGGSVQLNVTSNVTGQWYRNGSLIPDATASSYSATLTGTYTFVDTFYPSCPSDPSNGIAVTVNPLPDTPTITAGGPTTFCEGGSVTLTSSSTTGNQWYLNGNTITNATGQSYIAMASGDYTVRVTDGNGCFATSTATTVVVNPIPATPTISPSGSVTFCFRDPATLTSSSATGNQWYIENTPIGGATGQTLLVTRELIAAHSMNFNAHITVVVTENGCSSAASAPKLVSVLVPGTPSISAAGPTTFCASGSVELDVTPDGLTGQWYRDGSSISGATGSSYVATATGSYTFVNTFYTNCPSDPSNAIAVTVNPLPATPTITPEGPTTFCDGFSVTLTSSSATGNQWYLNGNPIGSATAQQYVALVSGNYTVRVTDGNGCMSAASTATAVVVNPLPPTPTITPGGPTTFCTGGGVMLTSSSATGNQWYLNGNPIGSATNQVYTATASGTYTVRVTDGNECTSAASTATTVTVNPLPATPTITPGGPTTFCAGGNVTLMSSSSSGNQWYLNGNPIGGASNQVYTATASGTYTVRVTDGNACTSAASTSTTVTVNPLPATPTITPGGPTTFCDGFNVTLTSSSATGNQWYLNGNPIGNATNPQYVATVSGSYTVKVTDGNSCVSAPSAPTSVTVNPLPATPTITPGGPTTFCAGGNVTLTSSSATGNQWHLNGNPIGGATGQHYVATVSGNYTVTVTDGNSCVSAPSTPTSVTVNPLPATPTITPGGPTTFCAGGDVTLTSSSASGNQWYLNGDPIGGATDQQYVASASGDYTVRVTDANGCFATSAAKTVTVNPLPAKPTINAGGPTTFCEGQNVTLTSSSTTGNQWFVNGDPIATATSRQYVATVYGNYTVHVTDGNGCMSAASDPTTVTVNPIPATPTATNDGPYVVGNTIHLSTTAVTGASYLWSGPNSFTSTDQNPAIPNATLAHSGSYSVTITVSGCTSPAGTTQVLVTAASPTAVVARATSTTSVLITWHSSAGASSYDVLRRGAGSGYGFVGNTLSLQFVDGTADANKAYLYIVRAVDFRSNRSPDSAPDLATTVMFAPITPNITPIRASDFDDLRLATNAVRELAGIGDATFSDLSLSGVAVKKAHIDELRVALNDARSALPPLAPIVFGETINVNTTPVRAAHLLELENGVQ